MSLLSHVDAFVRGLAKWKLSAKEWPDNEKRVDYRKTFLSDAHNRRVLLDLFDQCLLFSSTLEHDHATMAFAEGRRSVALYILTKIDPKDVETPDQAPFDPHHVPAFKDPWKEAP